MALIFYMYLSQRDCKYGSSKSTKIVQSLASQSSHLCRGELCLRQRVPPGITPSRGAIGNGHLSFVNLNSHRWVEGRRGFALLKYVMHQFQAIGVPVEPRKQIKLTPFLDNEKLSGNMIGRLRSPEFECCERCPMGWRVFRVFRLNHEEH